MPGVGTTHQRFFKPIKLQYIYRKTFEGGLMSCKQNALLVGTTFMIHETTLFIVPLNTASDYVKPSMILCENHKFSCLESFPICFIAAQINTLSSCLYQGFVSLLKLLLQCLTVLCDCIYHLVIVHMSMSRIFQVRDFQTISVHKIHTWVI